MTRRRGREPGDRNAVWMITPATWRSARMTPPHGSGGTVMGKAAGGGGNLPEGPERGFRPVAEPENTPPGYTKRHRGKPKIPPCREKGILSLPQCRSLRPHRPQSWALRGLAAPAPQPIGARGGRYRVTPYWVRLEPYLISSNSRPTFSKAARAKSRSSLVWVAVTMVRTRDLSLATVG